MTPMTHCCKSLIILKTDNNHSYLLFNIFTKKIYYIRVYPYTGEFLGARGLWGPRPPPRQRDPKGVMVIRVYPYIPHCGIIFHYVKRGTDATHRVNTY